jgi:hypothetical protein
MLLRSLAKLFVVAGWLFIDVARAQPTPEAALQNLHNAFTGSTVVHADSSRGGTATCPNGQVVIWGYSIMYHKSEGGASACMTTNTRTCQVGATNCTATDCGPITASQTGSSVDEIVGRISVLCGTSTVPNSYTKSTVATLPTDFPASVTCNATDTLVFGFKFIYSKKLSDCKLLDAGANTMCVAGQPTCDATSLSPTCNDGPMSVVLALCAPSSYGSVIARYGSFTNSQRTGSMTCPAFNSTSASATTLEASKPTKLLVGATLVMSDDYNADQVANLQNASALCGYSDGRCDITLPATNGDVLMVDLGLCIPPPLGAVEKPDPPPVTGKFASIFLYT